LVRGWDGRSGQGWLDLAEEADALVNLAGENIGGGLWTAERKQRILTSRLSAGNAVVDALKQAGQKPRVLLQSSAVGIYGPREEGVCDEGTPPGKDFLSGVAVRWEESTREVEEWGVRRVVARTGLVLHPREGILPRFALPFRLYCGGPMGSGRQGVSWIHIHDMARAVCFLLEEPRAQGVYNLCAPDAASNAEFGRALARALRRPYWLPAPAFALRLALGEMSTLILDGQRARPARLLAARFSFAFDDLDAALADLFHGGA
jgi:uncharacterized protein (TIGR01777 family)